jgi:anti-sigma-K factor RskA
MERTHEEMRTLIASYVLGAVPAEEVGEVRAHILSCDECMAEVESYAAVTEALADTVAPVGVPPGFADRVMDRAVQDWPARASVEAAPRWWRPAWAAAAGLLLLLSSTLTVAYLRARSEVALQERVVAALLEDDEGITLTGNGRARAKMVPTAGGAVFAARGLEEPPEGRTYQLWLLSRGCDGGGTARCEIVSVGTFEVSDGSAVLETSRPVGGFASAAVTIEPSGGSEQPTSDPVLASG